MTKLPHCHLFPFQTVLSITFKKIVWQIFIADVAFDSAPITHLVENRRLPKVCLQKRHHVFANIQELQDQEESYDHKHIHA